MVVRPTVLQPMNRPADKSAANDATAAVGFTRLEVPFLELFETAVAFEPECDPVTAHERLSLVFGQRAGAGKFLFRPDSSAAGRFWVRSVVPWRQKPPGGIALEPKRLVIQLASGLMYHFVLPVCTGYEIFEGVEKQVKPYASAADFESWFSANAPVFGVKPLMFTACLRSMRFRHQGVAYRIDHAVLEGALEVADDDLMRRYLQRGFGSHRRAGLGMLHLYN